MSKEILKRKVVKSEKITFCFDCHYNSHKNPAVCLCGPGSIVQVPGEKWIKCYRVHLQYRILTTEEALIKRSIIRSILIGGKKWVLILFL